MGTSLVICGIRRYVGCGWFIVALGFASAVPATLDAFARPVPETAEPLKISFQPHRAVYDIALTRVAAGSSIAALSGRMVYELEGSPCAGFTQILRFVTRATNQEGDAQLNDLRTKTWESPDSQTLKFEIENYEGGRLAERTEGEGRRSQDGSLLRVKLLKPSQKTLQFESNPLFPMAHAHAVLSAAIARQTVLQSNFYDGSEQGKKVFQTTAIIGKRLSNVDANVKGGEAANEPLALAHQSPGWPIAMSYFEDDEKVSDGRPSFEMSYRFHLNGVTSTFLIDHGDFAFDGRLVQLVFNDPKPCP